MTGSGASRRRAAIRFPTVTTPQPDGRPVRSFVWSFVAHGVALGFLIWPMAHLIPDEPAMGPEGTAGGGGGGGGRRVTLVAMAPLRSAPVVPRATAISVPVPVEVPTLIRAVTQVTPQPTPVPIRTLDRPLPLALVSGQHPGTMGGAGAGTGSGGGVGSGRGTGQGSGVGPGSGGEGGGVTPPSFRRTELPPEPRPPSLRGREFEITFFVNADGRVVDVDISPEVPNAGYRKRWIDAMKRYRFRPAVRADGTRVAGRAVQVVTL